MQIYTLSDLQQYLNDNNITHFSAKEITHLTRPDINVLPERDLWGNIIETLLFLEGMRLLFGPILIYSGYRPLYYNSEVGGAKNSQHLYFRAADSCPKNHKLFEDFKREVHIAWLQDGRKKRMGIGGYSNFVHIDFGFLYRLWGIW